MLKKNLTKVIAATAIAAGTVFVTGCGENAEDEPTPPVEKDDTPTPSDPDGDAEAPAKPEGLEGPEG